MQKLTTCLWFDDQAEEAVNLYTSTFKDSSIGQIARYPAEGAAIAGKEPGPFMTSLHSKKPTLVSNKK